MSRYLNPSKAKLEAKGVDSVRSRVVNLKELASEMTTDRLKEEMANAFQQVYGLPCSQIMPQELDSATLEAIYRRNCGWEWNYGKQLPFTFSCQGQFPWGGIQLQLLVEGGLVQKKKSRSIPTLWTGRLLRPWARPPWLPLCLDGAVSSSPQELPRAGRSPLSHAGRAGDLSQSRWADSVSWHIQIFL